MKIRLIVFAKAPLPGLAKTRLIPILGDKAAAELAETMLHHALAQALDAQLAAVELCSSPAIELWPKLSLPKALIHSFQGEGDLGERLARATHRALDGYDGVLLMGTDCPALTTAKIREASTALAKHDAVIIPATDGGYTLLGLRSFHSSLFSQIPWSTASVADITRKRIAALDWTLKEFPALPDIDEAEDLIHVPAAWLKAKA